MLPTGQKEHFTVAKRDSNTVQNYDFGAVM
jgi:hypothetical protein